MSVEKKRAYEEYKNTLNIYNENKGEFYVLLGVLLDKIDESVEIFNCDSNYKIGLATVEWSIKNGMTQQGYTALDETIKTFLCYKAGLSDGNEFWRDTIAKSIVKIYGNINRDSNNIDLGNTKMQWKMQCMRIEEEVLEKNKTDINSLIKCGNYVIDNMPFDLCDLTRKISVKRNNLNHFGFSRDTITFKIMDDVALVGIGG